MKRNTVDLGDVIGMVIATTYTVLIYISNTPTGTPAQADFVSFFTWIMLGMALIICSFDDKTILRVAGRYHMVRSVFVTNMLVQIVLLAITGHFVLFMVRLLAESCVHVRKRVALDRNPTANRG